MRLRSKLELLKQSTRRKHEFSRLLECLAFLCVILQSSASFAAPIPQLADVRMDAPGEWRTFAIGQLVAAVATGNGSASYWRTIPPALGEGELEHFYLSEDTSKTNSIQYGKLNFTVLSDGPVWMLITTRFFNSGNSSGNWQPEVKTQADLESQGWHVIESDLQSEYGYGVPGSNTNLINWMLLQRDCTTAEQFSIRTEKYQSPVILRTHSANDLFANRTILSGFTAAATNSNVSATRELNEPNHAGRTASKSLWWTWKAIAAGTVTLSTADSTVDTVLAVYTGDTLPTLKPVVSNDDNPNGGTSSLVNFRTQAGTEYQIAVDTFGGTGGLIHLSLSMTLDRPLLHTTKSGQNLIVSWPTNASGFRVQVSSNLNSNRWDFLSDVPFADGDSYLMKVPANGGSRFFRLISP